MTEHRSRGTLRDLVRAGEGAEDRAGEGADGVAGPDEGHDDEDSFPASDPPGGWAGPDQPPPDDDASDLGGRAVPEADSPETARAWAESEAMDGPAPTG